MGKLRKYIFTATVVIRAENEEDADVELLQEMDDHNIYWEKVENENY